MRSLIIPALILVFYAGIIIYSFSRSKEKKEKKEEMIPCEYCLRWSECNGIDADFCPLCKK